MWAIDSDRSGAIFSLVMSKYLFASAALDYGITYSSSNPLDAWLGIEIKRRSGTYPEAFFAAKDISCTDLGTGEVVGTMSAIGWHNLVLEDTYGEDWRVALDRASKLMNPLKFGH